MKLRNMSMASLISMKIRSLPRSILNSENKNSLRPWKSNKAYIINFYSYVLSNYNANFMSKPYYHICNFCCIGSGKRCKALTMLVQEFRDFAPYSRSLCSEAAALLTVDDFWYVLHIIYIGSYPFHKTPTLLRSMIDHDKHPYFKFFVMKKKKRFRNKIKFKP